MTQRDRSSLLHVDMDAFFVSVELLERPDLVGVPVAVAHDSTRAVITSASYEARAYGVRSAMPVAQAKRLCPSLQLLPPHLEKYRAASKRVMHIFREFTPLVEPLSIDEAFLDVGGAIKLFGSPRTIAERLKQRVMDETGLPLSVGLATTKFVAKLASQRAKPNGVLEIGADETLTFLHALPVEAVWGVGRVTAEKLRSRAIHTVKDLAAEPLNALERLVGKAAARHLHDLAHGIDPREVEPNRLEKSIGHESTFTVDLTERSDLDRELLRQAQRVGYRLRAGHLVARTVSIKVRWAPFDTVTRSRTLAEATNSTQRIYTTAKQLLDELGNEGRPVRLIGVRGEQLLDEGDLEVALWHEDERAKTLDATLDAVGEKFGRGVVQPARLIRE